MSNKNLKDLIVKQPIEDPFSIYSRPRKKHATVSYANAMFEQLDFVEPDLVSEIKEKIVCNIEEKSQNDFFHYFSKQHLFLNGATHEMIRRVFKEYVELDDKLVVLSSFRNNKAGRFLQLFGQSVMIDFISKSADNLTSAIQIDRVKKEDFESLLSRFGYDRDFSNYASEGNLHFFRYSATDKYIAHMKEYFDESEIEKIIWENFDFTSEFINCIPVMFNSCEEEVDRYEQDTKILMDRFGKTIFKKKLDDHYLAILFPTEKKAGLSFKKFSTRFHSTENAVELMKSQFKKDWETEKEMFNEKIEDYENRKSHIIKELYLAKERLDDLKLIDKRMYDQVVSESENILDFIEEIYSSKLSDVDFSFNSLNLKEEDLLRVNSSLGDAYSHLAFLEKEIEQRKERINLFERKGIEIIVSGYRTAEDREKFIDSFLKAVNEKDTYAGHSTRVGFVNRKLVETCIERGIYRKDDGFENLLRVYGEEGLINLAEFIGKSHDWGKILTPREILNKNGRPDNWEYEVIRKHVVQGMEILKGMNLPPLVYESAFYHHEFYDGSRGYPKFRLGKEIPVMARIVSISDVVDVIGGSAIDRNYDKTNHDRVRGLDDAIQEINRCMGSQFDDVFIDVFNETMNGDVVRSYYDEKIKEADNEYLLI